MFGGQIVTVCALSLAFKGEGTRFCINPKPHFHKQVTKEPSICELIRNYVSLALH